jgi:hypothetical protein
MKYNFADLLEAIEDVMEELSIGPRNQVQTLLAALEEAQEENEDKE